MQNSSNLGWVINGNGRWFVIVLTATLSLGLLLSGCQEGGFLMGDEGEEVTREIKLEAYQSIWTYGLFEIRLVQDTVHKAVVKGRSSVVQNIHFSQKRGRVFVREGKSNHWHKTEQKPLVEFHFADLSFFKIEEPSRLYTRDTLHTENLEVIVANELSEVDLLIDAGYFYLENWSTSTGRFSLKGRCRELEVKLCGSGTLEAKELMVGNARILQKSIADGYITVTDTLQVRSTGPGHIYYYGDPQEIIFTQQASGDLIRLW